MHLISIIVPVYNVEKYLRKCLNSIVNQTYKNLEIILVDDGSTDKSGDICDEYAANDDRVNVIHKANGGLSDARNVGLEVCSGDYIGFVDSDDYIELDMYEVLYKYLVENNLDVCMCESIDVCGDKRNYGKKFNSYICNIKSDIICELFTNKYGGASIVVWNKLYKKNVLKDIRFDCGKTYEDVFFILKWINNTNRFGRICEYKYFYVRREGSITVQKYFNENFLHVVEGYEKNLNLIMFMYPEATKCAEYRLLWSYKVVVERLYECVDYQNNISLAKKMQNEIRNRIIKFMLNDSCNWKCKIQYFLLACDIDLFMKAKKLSKL